MTTETQALPILESKLCPHITESSTLLFFGDSVLAETNSCGNEVLHFQQNPSNISLGWDDYPAVMNDGGNSYQVWDLTPSVNIPTDGSIRMRDYTTTGASIVDFQFGRVSSTNGSRGVEKSHKFNFARVENVHITDYSSMIADKIVETNNCCIKAPLEGTNMKSTRASKNVTFSTVHVREYDLTLGDHPLAVSYPLSLDWTYIEDLHQIYSVDEFDQRRKRRRMVSEDDDEEPIRHRFRGMVFKAFSKPPQLEVMERRSRIATCMQISFETLDRLERERKLVSLRCN
jgi:hypothetical protein